MSVYKNISAINFGGKNLNEKRDDEILIIGPEGGFSEDETAKFKKYLRSKYQKYPKITDRSHICGGKISCLIYLIFRLVFI